MKISSKCPIDDGVYDRYNKHRTFVENVLDESKLPDLACIVLQVFEECADNSERWSGTPVNKFTGDILSKMVSETWGMVGTLEQGAFSSCFHQVRSVIELVSFYNWVFYREEKREKRLQKYFVFRDLYVYQQMLKAETNPTLMASMKRRGTFQPPSKWADSLAGWAELFGVKVSELKKVKSWLYPASIQNAVEVAPGGDFLEIQYDFFSRVTHVSPHTEVFTGYKVLGLPGDKAQSIEAVDDLAINTCAVWGVLLGLIHKYHGFNFEAKFPAFMNDPPHLEYT